ncbi:MAG: hypothetical protein QW176_02065 [Candidatus Bathyarchaeia archaeon]
MLVQAYLYFDYPTWEYGVVLPDIISNYSDFSKKLLIQENGEREIVIILPQNYIAERVYPDSAYVDEYYIKSPCYHDKPFDGKVVRIRLNPESRPKDYYLDLSLTVEYSKPKWWEKSMPLWLALVLSIGTFIIGLTTRSLKLFKEKVSQYIYKLTHHMSALILYACDS